LLSRLNVLRRADSGDRLFPCTSQRLVQNSERILDAWSNGQVALESASLKHAASISGWQKHTVSVGCHGEAAFLDPTGLIDRHLRVTRLMRQSR
jgi:hypothetical protein